MVMIKLGRGFEVEVNLGSLFVRCGKWQRYWNLHGLPAH
jgi:hypothetical protein